MAITYHSGRRIQGTSSDRTTTFYRGETPVTVGSDTVITFLQDGTFTPTSSFDIEYLVVAGGGGAYASGGGAGGFRTNVSGATSGGGSSAEATYNVTSQVYTITVGDGGATMTTGDNSSIVPASGTSIISLGGGSGKSGNGGDNTPAGDGGSGGGSAYDNNTNTRRLAGNGTTGQGYEGGKGWAQYSSGLAGGNGGGGGAGGAGQQSPSNGTGGSGGAGLASSITGSAVTYASGGGGNGSGGGNTPNSGDGGKYNQGAGGSGIVIIRFSTSGNTYETSTSDMPTNVQVGSRFEETDTRKMYNYENNGTSELKAYYNMEQTSGNLINQQTTGDGLGSNADGTNTNVTQNSTGKVGTYSYSYNGTTSSSKTLLGSSTSQFNFLHADQATVSVNIWYKKTSVDTNFRTIIANTAAGAQNGFRMAFSGTNSLRVEIYNNGNNLVNSPHSSSSAIIPSNTDWHMLTVTVDRTLSSDNLIVYIDGSSVYTADKTSNSGTSSNAQFAMAIGDDQGGDGNMNGNFDELSIWNKVLTSDEITTLYNSDSGQVITDDMSTIWQEIGS